jgi:hypothetical protein
MHGVACLQKLVLAVLSSHAGKPCVIISKDLIAHVKELADKVSGAVHHCIQIRHLH